MNHTTTPACAADDEGRRCTREPMMLRPVALLERALHSRFTQYRNGNTEWFELSPEIFRFIAAPHPSATAVAAAAEDSQKPLQTVLRPIDLAGLRRAAHRLHRREVDRTGRPVTIGELRTKFRLSRREAAELRRHIIEEIRS